MFQRPSNRAEYNTLPRHPLIVCATLVQNPANLGGLCRTVEAFRLQTLVLSDLAIVHSPIFKNLAASSHHWQPLQACSKQQLPKWLRQQQQQNYSTVALTADSAAIALPQFTFPPQAVLLLGQELTGIPAALLERCEYRVTIPQFGMVESLNVQTAAAIAIYEYLRQRLY